MLKNHSLEFDGGLDDRIEFFRVASSGHPKLYSDHRSVANASVDLLQAGLDMIRIEINKSKGAMMPMAERLEDFVILGSHLIGRRIAIPMLAHVNA